MPDSPNDLVVLDRFGNPHDAQLLAANLESQGVYTHVADVHMTTAVPFMTVFSGGVRLMVKRRDESRARSLMQAFERGDFALPDDFDPGEFRG